MQIWHAMTQQPWILKRTLFEKSPVNPPTADCDSELVHLVTHQFSRSIQWNLWCISVQSVMSFIGYANTNLPTFWLSSCCLGGQYQGILLACCASHRQSPRTVDPTMHSGVSEPAPQKQCLSAITLCQRSYHTTRSHLLDHHFCQYTRFFIEMYKPIPF